MTDGNNQGDDGDEYYDFLPADHPLYKKLQNAIEDQLKHEEEKLRLEQKEKTAELKKIKRLREDFGVQLYNNQVLYAKLQNTNDENINRLRILESQRMEIDNTLKETNEIYKQKQLSISEQEKMFTRSNDELNKINKMLKYVADYNVQIASEINVTTTVAYQVENKSKDVEDQKLKQDFLIDHLLSEIATMAESKNLFISQLEQQKKETLEARSYIQDAQREIDKVQFRKQTYLRDWTKSLASIQTRDKALRVVRENILEQEGESLKYKSQNIRYNDLIQKEILAHNELIMELKKTLMKQKFLENQIKDTNSKNEKLESKRGLLTNTTTKTRDEIKSLDALCGKFRNDVELIDKNKIKFLTECRQILDKNATVLSSKETHEKQTDNMVKQNEKLIREELDMQVEIELKENETSRIQIDYINVKTQNEQLRKKINLMNNEITKLEKEFSKAESQIKHNHEDLEKKQLKVDFLNKKFGEISKSRGGEEEGIYELKIKELNMIRQNIVKDIEDTETEWLSKKTIIVAKEKVLAGLKEECVEGRSKQTILDHKKIRLKESLESMTKEITRVEVEIKNLGFEMNKNNVLLDKTQVSKEKLEHKLFNVEINFSDRLSKKENEAIKLEIEIEVLREEKSDTLAQVIEVERQIYLWERKIELENQMQKIIKPEKGLQDIDNIRISIHRQQLEYTCLKKQQEQVIKSMELAVQRRDFIKLKYPKVSESVNIAKRNPLHLSSSIDFSKQNEDLKFIKEEKKQNAALLNDRAEEARNVKNALFQVEEENRKYQNEYTERENSYYSLKLKKNTLFCKVIQNQKACTIIEDYSTNRLKVRNLEDIDRELNDYSTKNEQMLEILRNMRDIYPMHTNIIDNVFDI